MLIKTMINGQKENAVSCLDRGLQYGDGLFETIAISKGKSLCFDEHLARLEIGCKKLKFPPLDKKSLIDEVTFLSKEVSQGIVKVILTRGQSNRGYQIDSTSMPTRIISLYSWPEYPSSYDLAGVNLRVCQYRYSHNMALAGMKHLNRLEQILARSEWNDEIIAEGIVMDHEGYVIEGTMSNLFYVKDICLYTSDLSACGVAGIIRQKIIELSKQYGIDIQIRKISLDTLLSADEVFICNSVIGVWPVRKIDDRTFPIGPMSHRIKHYLLEHNCISTLCCTA